MKPLYELHIAASEFEQWLENDLKVLKEHIDRMLKEKDVSKIKDIVKTLDNLEHDTAKCKEWAEREAEAIEKV